MRNDRNVLHGKQHEIHSLKAPCSYGQNRKEQVVLTRYRIGHGRLTQLFDRNIFHEIPIVH